MRERWISAGEVLLATGIVVGHNVFHAVPNEVPILVVFALVSARIRHGNFLALGFRRPESWRRLLLIAVAAAALRIMLGQFVIDPLTAQFWPVAKAPAGADEIPGSLATVALWLGVVWSFAAFGEEIAYRGYLLRRAAEAGGNGAAAMLLASVLSSVVFGLGHYYKGPAGIIDSGIAGLILAGAYWLAGRNLWASVLAHGFIDTFGVIAVYLGWDS